MSQFLNISRWRTHGARLPAAWVAVRAGCVAAQDPVQAQLQNAAQKYIEILASVARQQPTPKTFCDIMAPFVTGLEGFRGATLLAPDFIIQQVYYKRHVGGIGYDVKSHDSLKRFYTMMREAPAPQVSGPTRARLWRPSYIALRYPIMRDGSLAGVVSLFVGTETLLQGTALADCSAFRISCSDVEPVAKGNLSPHCRRIVVELPSTAWTVEYDE